MAAEDCSKPLDIDVVLGLHFSRYNNWKEYNQSVLVKLARTTPDPPKTNSDKQSSTLFNIGGVSFRETTSNQCLVDPTAQLSDQVLEAIAESCREKDRYNLYLSPFDSTSSINKTNCDDDYFKRERKENQNDVTWWVFVPLKDGDNKIQLCVIVNECVDEENKRFVYCPKLLRDSKFLKAVMRKVNPSEKKRKITTTDDSQYVYKDMSNIKPEQVVFLMLQVSRSGPPLDIHSVLLVTHNEEEMSNFRGHIASIFWNAIYDAKEVSYHKCCAEGCPVANLKFPRGATVPEDMNLTCRDFRRLCETKNWSRTWFDAMVYHMDRSEADEASFSKIERNYQYLIREHASTLQQFKKDALKQAVEDAEATKKLTDALSAHEATIHHLKTDHKAELEKLNGAMKERAAEEAAAKRKSDEAEALARKKGPGGNAEAAKEVEDKTCDTEGSLGAHDEADVADVDKKRPDDPLIFKTSVLKTDSDTQTQCPVCETTVDGLSELIDSENLPEFNMLHRIQTLKKDSKNCSKCPLFLKVLKHEKTKGCELWGTHMYHMKKEKRWTLFTLYIFVLKNNVQDTPPINLEEVQEGICKLKAYIQARFDFVDQNFASKLGRKKIEWNEKTKAAIKNEWEKRQPEIKFEYVFEKHTKNTKFLAPYISHLSQGLSNDMCSNLDDSAFMQSMGNQYTAAAFLNQLMRTLTDPELFWNENIFIPGVRDKYFCEGAVLKEKNK